MVFVQMGCCLAALSVLSIGARADKPHGPQGLRSTTGSPHLLKLRRLQAHPLAGVDALGKSFYVGYMSVGLQPQKFQVTFDTASGQVVLPSSRCQSTACVERRRYVPQISVTGTDVNADGSAVQEGLRLAGRRTHRDALSIGFSSLDLGDGRVTGDLLREAVCLGAERGEDEAGRRTCAELGIVAATEMTEIPFRAMPSDGAVGLGLKGLSISQPFNFLGQFATNSRGMPPKFGMYLGPKSGEMAFGGYNPARLASPVSWFPVIRPEEGYWQVRILNVRIGNHTVTDCESLGGCRGIVDSCASRVGVPAPFLPGFEAALAAVGRSDGASPGCTGPDIHIELEGGTLVLHAEDYLAGTTCRAQLAPLQLPQEFAGAFLLGESVLRRYYSIFDAQDMRIGFGLAAAAAAEDEALDEEVPPGAELPAGVRAEQVDDSDLISEARGLTGFLLHALVMQVVVVLLLSLTGSYVKSTQLFVARLTNILARNCLLPRSSGLVAAIPLNEGPEGDDCVICLGSCEDSCCRTGRAGRGKPKWCRLRCGHQFHEECIFEWLWKVPSCPVCRCHMMAPGRSPPHRAAPAGGREATAL